MNAHDLALDLIKHFEGFRSNPYKCSAGVWTIGYGTTRINGRRVRRDWPVSMPEGEAERRLKELILGIDGRLAKYTEVHLKPNERAALISFCYNLGTGAFASSTLRRKINDSAPDDEISYEFNRWVHAGGYRLQGLVRRRAAEAELFLGDYAEGPPEDTA